MVSLEFDEAETSTRHGTGMTAVAHLPPKITVMEVVTNMIMITVVPFTIINV